MNNSEFEELKRKLENYFENKLCKMEEKLIKDYGILRGYSNEFTEMYHDYYDNILPSAIYSEEPLTTEHNLTQSQTPRLADRSKTPVRTVKIVPIKEEKATTIRIKITKNDQMSPRNENRPKTPILARNKDSSKSNFTKKEESKNELNKSSNNIPKKSPEKKKIERLEKIERPPKFNPKEKRDLTPNPTNKKKPLLDISNDNIKTTSNKTIQKDSNDGRKSPTPKRGTVVIKNGIKKITPFDSKKTIAIENIKLKTENSNKDLLSHNTEQENIVNNYDLIKSRIESKHRLNFSNRNVECLFIACNNKILAENLRIKLISNVKEIYDHKYLLKNILHERVKNVENIISEINKHPLIKYVNDPHLEIVINKNFTPSKTAQNGLNFVTKDEENNLCKKQQPEEILNVFRLIYILINESYESIPNTQLVDNLFKVIFVQMKVENLKSLFLNSISKNADLNEKQFENIIKIVRDNPKILSSPDLLKINRCVSYMTFFLKEIFEYVSAKTVDDTPLYEIRKINKRIIHYKEKLKHLQLY